MMWSRRQRRQLHKERLTSAPFFFEIDPIASLDFIEVYDKMLDAAACRALVDRFEASTKINRSVTGTGVDTTLKNSRNIRIDKHPEWSDAKPRLDDVASSR